MRPLQEHAIRPLGASPPYTSRPRGWILCAASVEGAMPVATFGPTTGWAGKSIVFRLRERC